MCKDCKKNSVCKYREIFMELDIQVKEKCENNVLYLNCNEYEEDVKPIWYRG